MSEPIISENGIKLGNYHYDIDSFENEDGNIEVYLTRYYEECEGCPLFETSCQGDRPPFNHDKYPCHNMKPIAPYEEQGYEFYSVDDIDEYREFTPAERKALKSLFKK